MIYVFFLNSHRNRAFMMAALPCRLRVMQFAEYGMPNPFINESERGVNILFEELPCYNALTMSNVMKIRSAKLSFTVG